MQSVGSLDQSFEEFRTCGGESVSSRAPIFRFILFIVLFAILTISCNLIRSTKLIVHNEAETKLNDYVQKHFRDCDGYESVIRDLSREDDEDDETYARRPRSGYGSGTPLPLQFRNLRFVLDSKSLSEADRLNGFEFTGNATPFCSSYRVLDKDWIECPANASDILGMVVVTKRNGQWTVGTNKYMQPKVCWN